MSEKLSLKEQQVPPRAACEAGGKAIAQCVSCPAAAGCPILQLRQREIEQPTAPDIIDGGGMPVVANMTDGKKPNTLWERHMAAARKRAAQDYAAAAARKRAAQDYAAAAAATQQKKPEPPTSEIQPSYLEQLLHGTSNVIVAGCPGKAFGGNNKTA